MPDDFETLIHEGIFNDRELRNRLLELAQNRLLGLTRKMFHQFPDLRRWEETGDIHQNVLLRLAKALESVKVESVRHFYNLAALQIRRELIDLSRHHFGPEGAAKHHHTDHQPSDEFGGTIHKTQEEPDNIQEWVDFHQAVECLPRDEQEIVNLLFYDGLTQAQASEALGMPLRSLKRKWALVKVKLQKALENDE